MAKGYTVEIENMDAIQRQYSRSPEITEKHNRQAMQESVLVVEKNIKPLVPVFMGRLRNSIGSEVQGSGSKIVGIIGSSLKSEVYPAVMEFGRRPGAKMPPPSALHRWVKLVMKVPDKDVPGVAFIVARAIGKKGIEGKRFMEQGLQQSVSAIQAAFGRALERIVKEIASGS